MRQNFQKFLAQSYARLEEIKENPYPDPAIDSVTVAMLVEKTNELARKAGCGHLVVRRDESSRHRNPADSGLQAIKKMLAWCQDHDA